MSNDFVTEIVGTGTYAIPSDDTELGAATSGLDALISGVANLTYERVLAWVEDSGGPGGAEGTRSLNCLIEQFTYLTNECPSETEIDTMTAAIESALEADANITSIGRQNVSCFAATGSTPYWNRDSAGFLYPNTITDDVAVGGATPNGKWFDDGDLVLGTDTMTGTEKLKVAGTALVLDESSANSRTLVRSNVSYNGSTEKDSYILYNADIDHTFANVAHTCQIAKGFYFDADYSTSVGAGPTVGTLDGFESGPEIYADVVVTTYRAFHADSPTQSGAITNSYGIVVRDQNLSSTTVYGAYI